MANIPKSKKKLPRTPPPMSEAKTSNLVKEPANSLVGLNLSVTPEFRKTYKTFAVDSDMSMAELIRVTFDFYREHHK